MLNANLGQLYIFGRVKGNPLPRFCVGGGAYSEPLGVRAITIINYGLEALRQLFLFKNAPYPFCAI